jgi:hypothetical protein
MEMEVVGSSEAVITIYQIMRGADKSLALQRKRQATGLKKCIYIFPPPELHTLMILLF